MLQVQSQRISELVGHLERMNVPTQTQDGKETQGSLLLRALKLVVSESVEMQTVNTQAMEELKALSEQHEVGSSPEEAVNKVVSYIKASHPKYSEMDDEAVKKSLGFGNVVTAH